MNAYSTTEKLKKKAFIAKYENIKQPIDIQLTFMLESKIEKYVFQQNMTILLAFLNQCHDVLLITYSTTKKLKSKALQ